ncbi:hypothetical protein FJZ26_01015 [Candidatus Parvarchaeota archaeon]|nr:hypothetical protein [Candidatus Parvarchaeota archaeon]
MNWKNALHEAYLVYRKNTVGYAKLGFLYFFCVAMSFAAPLAVFVLVFFASAATGTHQSAAPASYAVLALCVVAGILISAIFKGGFYSAILGAYDAGNADAFEFIGCAGKNARESIVVEGVQYALLACCSLPFILLVIFTKTPLAAAVALLAIFALAVVIFGTFSLAQCAIAMDGYGAKAALKKSYMTARNNIGDFAEIQAIIIGWFVVILMLVPVGIGLLALTLAYLPISALMLLLFYRSRRVVERKI